MVTIVVVGSKSSRWCQEVVIYYITCFLILVKCPSDLCMIVHDYFIKININRVNQMYECNRF